VGSYGLQKVQDSGPNDGLRAALHSQLATQVVDVPLDRVHTLHKATRDLTVGGALKQQA